MSRLAASNPYRKEVLAWYHKIGKSAFAFPWNSDEDAMYVLQECRRLFRQNQFVTDVTAIQRKLREAEMRYELAIHYRIPYPRPTHKPQGSMQDSSSPYNPSMDSLYDNQVSHRLCSVEEGSVNGGIMGCSEEPTKFAYDDVLGYTEMQGMATSMER